MNVSTVVRACVRVHNTTRLHPHPHPHVCTRPPSLVVGIEFSAADTAGAYVGEGLKHTHAHTLAHPRPPTHLVSVWGLRRR